MKWLRKNWTMILLLVAILLLGFFWRGDSKENKFVINNLEQEIGLREDTIAILKIKQELVKQRALVLEDTIVNLKQEAIDKEEVIKQKDQLLINERQKIRELSTSENVDLLARNLSEVGGAEVKLEMMVVRSNDTLVNLQAEHVGSINEIFAERAINIEKMNGMQDLLNVKDREITTHGLLVAAKNDRIDLLEQEVEQKDNIIANKDDIINEQKKKNRKDKWRAFGTGLVTGLAIGLGLPLVL